MRGRPNLRLEVARPVRATRFPDGQSARLDATLCRASLFPARACAYIDTSTSSTFCFLSSAAPCLTPPPSVCSPRHAWSARRRFVPMWTFVMPCGGLDRAIPLPSSPCDGMLHLAHVTQARRRSFVTLDRWTHLRSRLTSPSPVIPLKMVLQTTFRPAFGGLENIQFYDPAAFTQRPAKCASSRRPRKSSHHRKMTAGT